MSAATPGPIAPHGGTLIDRLDPSLDEGGNRPRVTLSARQQADLDLIAVGAMSPLDGFMDKAAYGLIVVQGDGTFGSHRVSAPTMIRFGEMTQDELFVTAAAATAGVRIEDPSASDPLVILKHFGPGNPDAEPLRALRRH